MELKEYYHDQEGYIFHITSSADENLIYTTSVDIDNGWYCTCEDYKFRKHKCKHIKLAEEHIQKHYPTDYDKYHKLDAFVKKP